MYMCVCASAWVSVHYLLAGAVQAKRGCLILWNWSYRQLQDIMWVLSTGLRSSAWSVLITSKTSLQPQGTRENFLSLSLCARFVCVYVLLLLLLFLVGKTKSLSVAQANLELKAILLPQPPKCRDYRCSVSCEFCFHSSCRVEAWCGGRGRAPAAVWVVSK